MMTTAEPIAARQCRSGAVAGTLTRATWLLLLALVFAFTSSLPLSMNLSVAKLPTGRTQKKCGGIMAFPAICANDIAPDSLRRSLLKCTPAYSCKQVSWLLHGTMVSRDQEATAAGRKTDSGRMTTSAILSRITRHGVFERYFPNCPAFIVRTRYGARFVEANSLTSVNSAREAHWGQTLSVLGELGLPPEYSLETVDGPAEIADVVRDLAANFSFDEHVEWAATAMAFYLPPRDRWTDKFGRTYSFDEVVSHFTRRRLGEGASCAGTHVLFTLAVILQVDRRERVLSSASREMARSFLKRAAVTLTAAQESGGAWTANWAGSSDLAPLFRNRLDRVWITGHHLDWMAIADDELRVNNDRLLAAGRFVISSVLRADDDEVARNPCPYTHGVRAVARLTW